MASFALAQPDVTFEQVAAGVLGFFTDLTDAEQRISLSLYRLLAEGQPVSMRAVASAANAPIEEAERALARWPDVDRARGGTVLGYWGLTLRPTRHCLLLGDRVLYAVCAWDTLFLPELLEQPARVQSNCPVSGKRVALEVGREGVKGDARHLPISLIRPGRHSNFSGLVHFFSTSEAGSKWLAQHPGTVLASLEQAWQLGRRRNALRYAGKRFP